ncbi:MAG TPA: hypothetical protein VF212_04460 [Longimicrobiales bacterium]
MSHDPELKAMSDVAAALAGLDPDAIRRIIEWAADRYQVRAVPSRSMLEDNRHGEETQIETDSEEPKAYDDFASFYDAADPQTSIEKALVAAYWFQVVQGADDIDSYTLNKELKHLGHPSTNITRDLGKLINRKPRLVIQVRKGGNSQQARKRYKVTVEGRRAVEKMVAQSRHAES